MPNGGFVNSISKRSPDEGDETKRKLVDGIFSWAIKRYEETDLPPLGNVLPKVKKTAIIAVGFVVFSVAVAAGLKGS
ncbi:hypothetical protein BH20ACT21_BH20ACT21_12300 [soil metagenome]